MPLPKGQVEAQLASTILGGVNDWLSALPTPEIHEDQVWREKPIDLHTWLYDPIFMNLGAIQLSPIQFAALEAVDDINPDTCQYTEYVLEWGKGSTLPTTTLTDLATGETKTYRQWAEDGRSLLLRTWNGKEEELRQSGPVRSMGLKSCSRVTFSNNAVLEISNTHRLLTPDGWKRLDELLPGDQVFSSSSNVQHEALHAPLHPYRVANSRYDYHHVSRLYGEQSQKVPNIDQGISPLLSDVPRRNHSTLRMDEVREVKLRYIGLKNRLVRFQSARYLIASLSVVLERLRQRANAERSLQESQLLRKQLSVLRPIDTGLLFLECGGLIAFSKVFAGVRGHDGVGFPSRQVEKSPCSSQFQGVPQLRGRQGLLDKDVQSQGTSFPHSTTIVSIESIGEHECFDLTMPITNCYFSDNGILNHNSGKDLIAALMALRQVYLLLCLKDPYSYYGMAPGSGIELCNVAYVKEQAKLVYFKTLKGLLDGSRWFKRHKIIVQVESIKFPYNITMLSKAADGDSVEGQNMFFAVMDEASAFKDTNTVRAMNKAEGEKVKSSADGIYDVLRTSTRSRFPSVGKVVIISYARYKGDFTQTKRKENENSPHGWTSGPYPTWEVNPRVKREDFQEDYDKNPEMARAMYESDPPFSVDGFVKHPEKFIHAVARGKSIGMFNPIDEDGIYNRKFEGIPGKYYAIHVDLALNRDKCALALACQGQPIRRWKCPCQAFNFRDVLRCQVCQKPIEQWQEILLPTLMVPLLKYFAKTGEKQEVDFAEVREDILWIREKGHNIYSLTYDGWQSQDSIQIMDKILGNRKVRTRRYGGPADFREESIVSIRSVDRTTQAHDTLKEFIYDDRAFFMPGSELDPGLEINQDVMALAYREWRSLKLLMNRKIDHPRGGCFVGETRIPLLDGSFPTMLELASRKDFWLYSSTPEGGIVYGKARGFLSKRVSELVDVVLDNGAVVRCTPEHRFLLSDGTYKEAQNLCPERDRLKSWPRSGWPADRVEPCRVISVFPIQVKTPVPVYDLEVEDWNNFALSSGVFVHNSKDLVDALAGSALAVSEMPMMMVRQPALSGWSEA